MVSLHVFLIRQKSTGEFSSGTIPAYWGGIRQAMIFTSRFAAERHTTNPQVRSMYQRDFEIVEFTLVELAYAANAAAVAQMNK